MAESIGKYQIVRKVGEGTTGSVYLAHDPFRGLDVAVKIYNMDEVSEPFAANRRKMFFNEASMVGRLHHPNILPILDAGEEDGRYFVAMENVHGARSLDKYSKPDRLLATADVIKAVFKCAKALHHASRHGVIHRDVKPSNVMLTLDSEVKLIDFGIAQNAQGKHSQIRDVAGSPVYMSPEQIRGERVTHRSDLYSLGVMLFVLLTGKRPFMARTLDGLLQSIVHDEPICIATLRPDLPAKLHEIVKRSMQKDRQARFADGQAFAAELFSVFHSLKTDDTTIEFEERTNRLRQLSFFTDFARREIRDVLRVAEWRSYAQDDRIVNPGELEAGFYIIISGSARLRRGDENVTTLGAGDCFGEAAIVDDARQMASVEATGPVDVLRVSAARLDQMPVAVQLRFSKTLLRSVVARLTKSAPPGQPVKQAISSSADTVTSARR